MALQPCAKCGVKYIGKATTSYFFLSGGPGDGRYKMQFCPRCAEDWIEHLQELLQEVDQSQYANLMQANCPSCLLPMGNAESMAIVATVYGQGREMRQWWGAQHVPCAVPPTLAPYLQNGRQAA